jgi:asparagine synthase (glutamine-hydrolysing)
MCGICGIVYSDGAKEVGAGILRQMTGSLCHRGPDDEGQYINGNVGLGMRRLSIIDLKTGHQPIFNENKTVCLVCNGEIYNYRELRKELEAQGHQFSSNCDVEVIIHLYEEFGEDFVHRLRGMFGLAIYDISKDSLILIRDRIGIKPLYYTYQNGKFIFASEIKAILRHPDVGMEISTQALSDYLTYLYIPGPGTIFEDIYKLPPAHILTFKAGNLSMRQYWELDYKKNRIRSQEYYIEGLRDLLIESVRMHLVSDVPLGAFLSGGIDSSTIVALMSEIMKEPVRTFSVGFDVAGFNELKHARLIADKFSTEHYEISLKPDIIDILPRLVGQLDEPFADSSIIPTFLICEFARQKVKVCLAGDGGDELFAGYGWTRRQKFINDFNRLPRLLRTGLKLVMLGKDYSPDLKNSVLDKIKRFIYDSGLSLENSFMRRKTCFSEELKMAMLKGEFYSQLKGYKSFAKILPYFNNDFSGMEKLLFFDTKSFLPDDGLLKVDTMSMLNSFEVRVPFLDHKVVEFAATIPFKYKIRGSESKYIVKKMMKHTLPTEVLRQRKLGFTIPLNSWFRDGLRGYAEKLLLDPGAKIHSFFNHGIVRWLINEHIASRQDFGPQIFSLLVLELWLSRTLGQE